MEKKRMKAESNASYRAKVNDAGGKDAWALQQAQCALAAEEARSKLTAEEAELEAMLMKRNRQNAESIMRSRAKVKLVSALEQ